ncbi:sensor histidine kinase [Metabacillus fastidiosus]|uniref:sensor histidine kinase n=1 Tax=Metabacillus fastidiosus TaxID=1458 RepID=UPI003D29E5B6
MFQRTRIKLTILNSVVFIILIGVLAAVIYSYAESRLYGSVNRDLLNAIEGIRQPQPPERLRGLPAEPRDPRIVVLIWDKHNNLVNLNEDSTIFADNKDMFQPAELNRLKDIEAEGFYFRTAAVKEYVKSQEVTVQFVRNITSEKEMLHTLLLILIIGSCLGSLCAVGAGFFLAGRALVPIKEAWKKQQQFVSDASHELRTPLAVIQSKTDLLWRVPSSTIQEKAVDISIIARECRRLSKLVANLLMLARSDSDQLEIEKEEFSLNILLDELMEYYSEIVSYQGKEIKLNKSSSILFTGDRERIHQLLVILLDNALKYTKEGGEIIITCSESPASIFIEVQDNGIGIEKEHLPKVFDRFYQVDKSRTAEGGAGLGLSIAKWIVDKHQGKIKIESVMEKGTTVKLTFARNVK